MSKKFKKRVPRILTDPMYIDEAGLMRYDLEMPEEALDDEIFVSVKAVEGSESGLIPESMRTPEDNLRIRLAANLVIDWLLQTYGAQYNVKPGSDDNSLPGVL